MRKRVSLFLSSVLLAAIVIPLLFSNVACFEPRVAVIGVIAPLDAGLVEFGLGIRNAVQLAVDEANATCAIPGWQLEVVALDDSSDPATGADAARTLAADPRVIGVVGTYNSGVAMEAAPILEAVGISMISPGNTDPALTLGDDPENPLRPFGNYFRVVASDAEQGPFLASCAYETMQFRKVAVVTETKPVSKGLANAFTEAFEGLGGTILTTEDLPDGASDYEAILDRVATLDPDLLFFGGEYGVGAEVRVQATAAGIMVPMMGGDGLKAPAYVETAGVACEGDFASTVGAPATSLPSAQPFLDAYEAAGFNEPPADFGPYAYDAANVLVVAAQQSLGIWGTVDDATRTAILTAIQATDTDGVTGPMSFDAYGDTTNQVLTMYSVVSGAWTPLN